MNVSGSKKEIGEFFDKVAPLYGTIGPEMFSFFGRTLAEAAAIRPGSCVLDIACGRGAVLFPAAASAGAAGSVVGIDISRSMIANLNEDIAKRECASIKTVHMDAEDLQFADQSFDYVLCGFGIFFFPNPIGALEEAFRVLKTNGTIAISTWEGNETRRKGIRDALAALPYEVNVEEALRMLPKGFESEDEIRNNLTRAGFSNISVRVEKGIFYYQNEEEWWSAQWSHGIRLVLETIERQAGKEGLDHYKKMIFNFLQNSRQPEGIRQEMKAFVTVGKKYL
jgi:ubiquinone/menaquinone biosynthesis C-methylase UbiE